MVWYVLEGARWDDAEMKIKESLEKVENPLNDACKLKNTEYVHQIRLTVCFEMQVSNNNVFKRLS